MMEIPEGWKLVPIEPTMEMFEAGDAKIMRGPISALLNSPGDIYAAMLGAAPSAAAPASQLSPSQSR